MPAPCDSASAAPDKHCSLQGKIDLLTKTNMVDYAMDIYQNLHSKAAPQSMKEQRSQVQSAPHCHCLPCMPGNPHQGAVLACCAMYHVRQLLAIAEGVLLLLLQQPRKHTQAAHQPLLSAHKACVVPCRWWAS